MPKSFIFLTLIFIYFCLPFKSYCQDRQKKKKDDSGTQKIEIIQKDDYFNDGKSKSNHKTNPENIIKIDPVIMPLLEGEIPIYYERKLGGNFSFQLGIGITFHNSVADALHGYTIDVDNYTFTSSPGLALHAEIRAYFDAEDFPEGSYMFLAVASKNYNINYQGTYLEYNYPDNIYIPYSLNTVNTYKDLLLGYGRQLNIGDGNLYVGYDVALGLSMRTTQKLKKNEDYSYNTVSITPVQKDFSTFTYSYGLRIGFAF